MMPGSPDRGARSARVTGLALVTLAFGLLALFTPLRGAEYPASRVGWLLAFAAAVEMLHALRRSTTAARRQATGEAVVSMMIALLLINAPLVTAQALRLLVAAWFGLDAVRQAARVLRESTRPERSRAAIAALGNTAVVALLLARGWALAWVVAIAGALRIFGIAWHIMTAPIHTAADADESVIDELGLADQPEAARIAAEVEAAERARAPIDRRWTASFITTLFAIHVGRMRTEATILGLISPAVAVLGDV